MATKTWLDSNTRVWVIDPPNEPLFLLHVGVELIEWPDKAIITGLLPRGAILDKLSNGITFEILLYPQGAPPDDYDYGDVIIRLSVCRIVKKCIMRPVVLSQSYDSRIALELTLGCDIELLAGAEEWLNCDSKS